MRNQMKQILFLSVIICILIFLLIENSYSDDWTDYYRKNEKSAIQSTGGTIKRIDDKTLSLKLSSGKEVILADKITDPDDDKQVRYVFRNIDSTLGGYLLDIWYWEDYDVLLLHLNDGSSQVLPDVPIYNPSKTRFLCIEDSPLSETKIHIYEINKFKLEKEFSYTPNDQGAENPKWLNDSEVAIDLYKYRKDLKGNEIKDVETIHFICTDQQWKIKK
jgi:hypothetical protein